MRNLLFGLIWLVSTSLFASTISELQTTGSESEPVLTLRLGALGAFSQSFSKESRQIPSYDGSNALTGGALVELLFFHTISLESGAYYRYAGTGTFYRSIITHGIFFPGWAKFHYRSKGGETYFGLGMGITRMRSGTVVQTVAKQAEFAVPSSDLTDEISYMLKLGQTVPFNSSLSLRLEGGFEYAERSIRVITRELFFGMGVVYEI